MGNLLGMKKAKKVKTVKEAGKRLPFGSDEEIAAYREGFGELADKSTFEVARTIMLHLELLRQRVDLSYRGIWCQFGEHYGTDYGYAIEGHCWPCTRSSKTYAAKNGS